MSALTLTLTLKQHYNKKKGDFDPEPDLGPLFTDTSTKFFLGACLGAQLVALVCPFFSLR